MKIHLIGAGGAGVSALGNLYLHQGHSVTGSDKEENKFLAELVAKGLGVLEYGNASNVTDDIDLVVYSNAIIKHNNDNPELQKAKEVGVETLSYPQALGKVTERYTTVAIAGTHGKTTTTAMLLHILVEAGVSPTGIVGSLLSKTGSNFVAGESNLLIIEADEYMKAFLNHSPDMIGVTNIDHDHHDVYPNLAAVKETFQIFANKLPEPGVLVCSTLDQVAWSTFEDLPRTVIDYSSIPVNNIDLKVPGEFNRKNAQLAIALALELGVSFDDTKKHLESFTGTWRRQEYKGKTNNGALVYDDYAHHPTEINASLQGFREQFPKKNITVIFQPHLYSRTKKLFTEFGTAFGSDYVDQVIILPVYAAREEPDVSISNQVLTKEVAKLCPLSQSADDFAEAASLIVDSAEIVVTMGAGDVTKLSDQLAVKK